ncbi:Uncharacterised protein [Legionella pneumophila]|nr:Uncharacterised protein [Legionella pneumophila]CZJ34756.1 Uncharacterised protein [Legionella pneumophila]CZJ45258.1 Uncharacterised protein [Legionella pneumophila]CZJ47177.1 Uncharacterised protein [Legionella pneumophila]CZJ69820.1 Uncharacterised protein [Legionella pneumophila]
MFFNVSGTKGTFGAGTSLLGFSRPHPLQLRWSMWDLLNTISTNKNAFHLNNSFKLGIGLKLNEGMMVGFFSLS